MLGSLDVMNVLEHILEHGATTMDQIKQKIPLLRGWEVHYLEDTLRGLGRLGGFVKEMTNGFVLTQKGVEALEEESPWAREFPKDKRLGISSES
jgi:hypothetical protein